MKISKLKTSLGLLLFRELENFGISLDDIETSDDIHIHTTTDSYCKKTLESIWVASVNDENNRFMVIAVGNLNNELKAPEVSRIFIDEPKAEMLLAALAHSYPKLLPVGLHPTENREVDTNISESDRIIAIYEKIKIYASNHNNEKATPTVIDQGSSKVFLSNFPSGVTKIVEADITNIAKANREELPIEKISKTFLVETKLLNTLTS